MSWPGALAIEIGSGALTMNLDESDGLRAVSMENRLAQRTLKLARGTELEAVLDPARRSIGITGWKFAPTQAMDGPADKEHGFISGAAGEQFNDSGWSTVMTPNGNGNDAPPAGYAWARRRIRLEEEERGQPVSFTLGGFGLFDYQRMRVFLNGQLIGERNQSWAPQEPLRLTIRPTSPQYKALHFGAENVLALQLSKYQGRLARLNEFDPEGRWDLSRFYWPPTFEQRVTIGEPPQTLKFKVLGTKRESADATRRLEVSMRNDESQIGATVTYTWQPDGAVLHKFVHLTNQSTHPVCLLDVQLGRYSTGASTTQGQQGHPVYADGSFFFGVVHPAGWSTAEAGEIRLHQHPGITLEPGKSFDCFETVYGAARRGEAAEALTEYIRSRMRRVVRKHDHPYAFYEPFGSDAEKDKYDAREDRLLPAASALDKFARQTGCSFDACSIEFWEDLHGDRSAPDPGRFPNGFKKLRELLAPSQTPLGLWTDITGPDQSIGLNPAIAPTLNFDPAFGTERRTMCLATEPMPRLNRNAFVKHAREGTRLLKFDGYWAACRNQAHAHLPGIYATEAIDSAFINLLRQIDEASPNCFFELYGGYHSPWWLLYADTIYESGIAMEAATPGPWPTLWARDGVTRVLDQATEFSREDVPALGKDSLGIWLSDWKWNSGIGSERWQAGFVMDLMRGSLLAQPWCDLSKLPGTERSQLAEFIRLLRAAPQCFERTRRIAGSPWKNEPYGWCGTDGRRALIALNNGTWQDQIVPLELNEAWGLPAGKQWEIYRRWPEPAKLSGEHSRIALRPFEIVLLEAVSFGEKPLSGLSEQPVPSNFAVRSRELQIRHADGQFVIDVPASPRAYLAITADVRLNGRPLLRTNAGSHWQFDAPAELHFVPVLAQQIYYRCSWQAWRAEEIGSSKQGEIRLKITADAPPGAEVTYKAYLIPIGH
jgi:hypothetical protein